ncbi:NEDD8-activating enzyme E1 regulatory subunit-like protein [Basidiobolus meristosporus CBS 931.73]|uniref:NEDD8-activating enzyme E1 regulatory subunit n=1 Tax=Basidiobolus meristosporus CBS 931.73 TaxID=1314790 RepID=A0A1Y1XHP8_9FUNG|nr:NEDD8-activating enzyme E1 regulatory subunit-like protein [Basidiobolus meristosporus CBS 931.73]|eukprot:ORX85288.1 NEDD8-activating enzyme E1 regulatory subunit-like protein [Basidiobolus meristosporus CBS 931.73]
MDPKTQKYDRQLRLWHSSGQTALENAKVCLVHGTATGAEILKNLILPGIGSFTVLDNQLVKSSDVGSNFFLELSSVNQSRAQAVTQLLKELNEDVEGFHIDEDVYSLIEHRPEFFKQFSVVIASDVPEKYLVKLSEYCWREDIALVVVRNFGYMGYFRIAVPEHTVIEAHSENTIDLRVDCPFAALQDYSKSFELDTMSNMDHGNVPYVVILLQALDKWKKEHDGKIPTKYAEKNELKQWIRQMSRSFDEENFEEAINMVLRVCNETGVPSEVQNLFASSSCNEITSQSSDFWLLVRALKEFVNNEGNGLLPVTATLPDMKSDTERYIALQNIYRQKAKEDLLALKNHLESLLTSVNRPADSIPEEKIETFCKNAAFLKALKFRSIADEYQNNPRTKEIRKWLEDETGNLSLYVIIRAVDRFYEAHKRYPGQEDETVEDDIKLLKESTASLLNEWGLPLDCISEDYIQEVCRTGLAELPSIAALLGGIVSQEVIKLITRQYIPLNNTCLYNGIKATVSTYEL